MLPDELATERLVLRRFTRRDAEALNEAVAFSIPQLNQWLPWAHLDYDREDAASFIRDSLQSWREGRAFDFAVRRPERPDHHLGNVSIWQLSKTARTGEVGYWVRSGETGQGIATEATGRLVRVGFEDLGFHKITLRVAVGNRASERVAEKLGFVVEGLLREELSVRGRWLDHTLYGLLDHEYRAARRKEPAG